MAGVRPGDPQPAAGDLQAARRAARPLHAPLEPDCPATAEATDLAARSRLRLASAGQGSAWPSPLRSDARGHAGRDAGVGERGALAQFRPAAAPGLPPLRDRRRQALPLGSLLADLERAEQAALAQADEVDDLRPASAQPWIRGDPRRAATRPGRWRRDRALVAPSGGVAPTAWVRGMAAARAKFDAYAHHPYPATPSETPSSGGCRDCPSITMATIRKLLILVRRSFGPKPIWLTEYGYQTRPPDTILGVPPKRQATMLNLAAMRAWRLPRVTMLIQYLYRDEVAAQPLPDRPRFRRRPPQALAAGIQAAVCADAAERVPDGRLGSDPRRTARAEVVPARGAPQERVEGGRGRPADERPRCLRPDDSPQAGRAAPDLVAETAALQSAAAGQMSGGQFAADGPAGLRVRVLGRRRSSHEPTSPLVAAQRR